MYERHFGLTSEAFSLTPDPAFLYLSPDHAEALAALKIGVEGGRGLICMIGEVGTGKTTLVYSLLSEMSSSIKTAFISNTTLSFDEMLRQALSDFDVVYEGKDRVELLTALNGFLRQCAAEKQMAALIIDEAQNLSDDAFENLRLLSNYETYTTKLLQIVLVGQPELEAKLRKPNLRQVNERIAVRCYINPLDREQSQAYIEHRLHCAGGSPALFTPGAMRLVLRKARGIPRRINIICHNALLFAYGRSLHSITSSVVRAAVKEREGRGFATMARIRLETLWAHWTSALASPTPLGVSRWWTVAASALAGAGFALAVDWAFAGMAASQVVQ